MKKYKNIIFDMGNVLLDYAPHTIVSNFTSDTESINTLVKEVFYQQEWLDLDQGILSYDDAYILFKNRLHPKYHSLVKDILNHYAFAAMGIGIISYNPLIKKAITRPNIKPISPNKKSCCGIFSSSDCA